MKKSGVMLLILVLLVSISFASAGLLDDVWNKITGRVVENQTEATNETEIKPCPSIIGWRIENNECVSDSGCDYDSSVYTYYNSPEECEKQLEPEAQCGEGIAECLSEQKEYCEDSNACTEIIEYKCIDGKCVAVGGGGGCTPCEYGCKDGVCLREGEEVAEEKGLKIIFPALNTVIDKPTEIVFTITNMLEDETLIFEKNNPFNRVELVLHYDLDHVGHGGPLWETTKDPLILKPLESVKKTILLDPEKYYRGKAKLQLSHFVKKAEKSFEYGSLGGAEIEIEIVNQRKCADTDSRKRYDVMGFVYTQNKVYYDKCVVPVNRTNGGYVEKGGIMYDYVSWDNNECDGSDCYVAEAYCTADEVQDFDIKFCPDGCKNGKCIGEEITISPDEEGPVSIPEEEIFYFCDGCELDNKCYPFGYRKSREYCSIDNEFINQLEADSSCDNNFECESNVCVSGECVSGGLIKKIIGWFKNLFGIQTRVEEKPEALDEEMTSSLELKTGLRYRYVIIPSNEEARTDVGEFYLDVYVTKETDKEWEGITVFKEEHEGIKPHFQRFKIDKDNLILFSSIPLQEDEILNEDVQYITMKELEKKTAGDTQIMVMYPFILLVLKEINGLNIDELIENGFTRLGKGSLSLDKTLQMHKNFLAYEVTWSNLPGDETEVVKFFISKFKPYLLIDISIPRELNYNLEKIEKKAFELSEYEDYYAGEPVGRYEDTKMCEKITDYEEKRKCYGDIARETKDISVCDKIKEAEVVGKDECYRVVAIIEKDYSICGKISRADTKDLCYVLIGVQNNNISSCEKVVDDVKKGSCYGGIAKMTKDVSLCEIITHDAGKDGCYTELAVELEDISLCEKIIDSDRKDRCYRIYARETKDVSPCENIVGSTEKSWCYADVAKGTKDSSLCEKVTYSYIKELCYEYVA